jgi:hypothetical protein
MTGTYAVHLPEENTPGHCFATFATSITAFSIELGTYFDNQMRAKEGPYWFENLRKLRILIEPRYKNYKNRLDFLWIVNESVWFDDSPIKALLPSNEHQVFRNLRELGDARNQWYHDHNPHNIGQLRAALNKLKYLADKCGLELADELVPVIDRVNAIAAGSYKPEPAKSDNEPEPTTKSPQALRQAAVGAAWLGPVGVRKIQLTRAGSLIDLGAEKNVTSEMGPSNRYLELWQALNLDWLWVDSLGSVAAYVQGSLRMVGYWGADPEDTSQDPFAKFLLPHSYIFADGVICHLETLKALDHSAIGPVTKSTLKRASESIQEGAIMRLTWDGDLIHFGDNGPEYLGEVESSDWFAGHFFVPTAEA